MTTWFLQRLDIVNKSQLLQISGHLPVPAFIRIFQYILAAPLIFKSDFVYPLIKPSRSEIIVTPTRRNQVVLNHLIIIRTDRGFITRR